MQLASGDVPVRYETLPDGFAGTYATVARMRQAAMGRYGARSPKIRALAINILRAKQAPEKNYTAEAVALGEWVRDNIRYVKDVYGQETLSYPEELAFNSRGGDCDDMSTLLSALLGSIGIPSRFVTIGVTPVQFSHVYLQAKPKDRWITMDPIMKDKQMGWEVPQARQAIRKVYPVNAPADVGTRGANMSGLGYVGDPRVESHLEAPIIPLDAGAGSTRPRAAGQPAYVRMPSGLDTDADISPLAKFPQNQSIGQRYPQQVATNIAPRLQRLTNAGPQSMDGFYDVQGPDELAGCMGAVPPENMAVPAYMQTKTVRQAPEGVDAMFGRASMVMDPKKGDKIEYYGEWSRAEKPPIQRYENIAGMDETIPGMGEMPADRTVGALAVSPTKGLLAAAAAVIAGIFIVKKLR